MRKPVNAIEIVDGIPVINLASSAANDDWIRAARLLKAKKFKEFEEMDTTPTFTIETEDGSDREI